MRSNTYNEISHNNSTGDVFISMPFIDFDLSGANVQRPNAVLCRT